MVEDAKLRERKTKRERDILRTRGRKHMSLRYKKHNKRCMERERGGGEKENCNRMRERYK